MTQPLAMLAVHGAPTPLDLLAPRRWLSTLNPLDWVLLTIVASSMVFAFARGLIRSLISLAGVVLGILLAAQYTSLLALWLRRWITQPAVAEVLAFVAILAGCYALAALLGRVLRGACKAVGLGILDRLGGAAFGFVRAALMLAAVLLPLQPFLPLISGTQTSVLLPYLLRAAHGVSFVMPRDFAVSLPERARLHRQPAGHSRQRSVLSPLEANQPRNPEGDAQ